MLLSTLAYIELLIGRIENFLSPQIIPIFTIFFKKVVLKFRKHIEIVGIIEEENKDA